MLNSWQYCLIKACPLIDLGINVPFYHLKTEKRTSRCFLCKKDSKLLQPKLKMNTRNIPTLFPKGFITCWITCYGVILL